MTAMDASLTADANWSIPRGAPVLDAAGEKLGTVVDADTLFLLVERGIFFVTDYQIPLEEVDRYEDGRLILKRTKAQLLAEGV